MRFHWDLALNCLLRSPASSARLNTVEFKRGDAAVIELVFYEGSQTVLLEPGHEIRFAIKRKGQHDGEPLVYTATFTENTDARTYTAKPSFNTAALTALFASPNAPDRLDLMGEFSLRNGDDSQGWQSSQTLNVCVFNDVIRGQEGTPGAATDAQQSWLWLLASLAAGTNLTFTPNHETRVLTLAGVAGASGNGWSPLLALVSDGERRVLQLTGWTGGSGDEPQGAGQYLGAEGWVNAIGDAVDLRGAAGLQGNPGTDGINGLDGRDGLDGTNGSHGWSPIFALVAHGERRVLQLAAWTGGTGTAPEGAGQYLGAAGLVSTTAEALDLRGAAGINGIDGVNGIDGQHGWTPVLAVVADGERRVLQLTAWTGGSGATPSGAGQYLGPEGWVVTPAEALDLRGAQGSAGTNGSDGMNGADATPITSINFDGSNLTLQTSTGQTFGPFYVRGSDGTNGNDGANGINGWSPIFAIVQDGERRVLQLQSWSGGTGSTPGSEGYYIGPSGLTPYVYEAVDLRGPQGPAGENGSSGADATPITGINFDGSYLTIYTSSGQSFGPFYVRGGDGPTGPPGADATPITQIAFDGYNLTIYTSSGQSFGPFYVRGNDGSNGNNGSDGSPGTSGWSPLFAVVDDGDRRVLQLQSWVGSSGSTPGYEGYYLGPSGFTPYAYEASDIRGQQGPQGETGSSGADATPITNIDFDGYNLTIHTSTGQSFGPFYVRGSDGPAGADGGGNGADGANGWSPLLSVVPDGLRRVIQLQSWTGGSGDTPGNEGSYLGPYGLTWSPGDATDISGNLQPLAPIDDVSSAVSLSGSDTVDVATLEAQIADLQSKLQQVLDRLRSHNLISVS